MARLKLDLCVGWTTTWSVDGEALGKLRLLESVCPSWNRVGGSNQPLETNGSERSKRATNTCLPDRISQRVLDILASAAAATSEFRLLRLRIQSWNFPLSLLSRPLYRLRYIIKCRRVAALDTRWLSTLPCLCLCLRLESWASEGCGKPVLDDDHFVHLGIKSFVFSLFYVQLIPPEDVLGGWGTKHSLLLGR